MGAPLLVGMALSAIGTGMSIYAGEQSKTAMNNALNAELQRQRGFQKKATPVYQESLAKSTPKAVQENLEAGKQSALAEYGKLGATSLGAAPPSGSDTIVQQQRRAQEASSLQGVAAPVAGWSEDQMRRYIKNLYANQMLGVYNTQARQSSNVLPYELQAAQREGDTLRYAGMGLSSLGSVLGAYGALSAATPTMSSAVTPSQLGMTSFEAAAPTAYSPALWGPQFSFVMPPG